MKFKTIILKVSSTVGLWILGKLKDLWEEKLKNYLKDQLHVLIEEAVDDIVELRNSEEYETKRKEIYNKVFDGIKLPIILKPFKGLIKKMLKDGIDEKISGALDALKKTI